MELQQGPMPRGSRRPSRPHAGGADCREALDRLYFYLDGELTEERRRAIQYHLQGCSPCLEAFDFEAELKAVVGQRCRETVPEQLRQRVAEALANASRSFPSPE